MQILKKLSLAAALALPLAACGGAEGPTASNDDGSGATLEESYDAFTGISSYTLTGSSLGSKDLGSSVNRTCFLAGVGGDLRAEIYHADANSYGVDSDFEVTINRSPYAPYNWSIWFSVGVHGSEVKIYARCVPTAAGRIEATFDPGATNTTKSKIIAADTPSRQCFLRGLTNRVISCGWPCAYAVGFGDPGHPDTVRVLNEDGQWKARINPGAHWDGYGNNDMVGMSVDVVCFDAVKDGSWSWLAGTQHEIDLTADEGANCGLTGFSGVFDNPDSSDDLYVRRTDDGQFKLHVQTNNQGWASCVK